MSHQGCADFGLDAVSGHIAAAGSLRDAVAKVRGQGVGLASARARTNRVAVGVCGAAVGVLGEAAGLVGAGREIAGVGQRVGAVAVGDAAAKDV